MKGPIKFHRAEIVLSSLTRPRTKKKKTFKKNLKRRKRKVLVMSYTTMQTVAFAHFVLERRAFLSFFFLFIFVFFRLHGINLYRNGSKKYNKNKKLIYS